MILILASLKKKRKDLEYLFPVSLSQREARVLSDTPGTACAVEPMDAGSNEGLKYTTVYLSTCRSWGNC